jgi:hypothetical protein
VPQSAFLCCTAAILLHPLLQVPLWGKHTCVRRSSKDGKESAAKRSKSGPVSTPSGLATPGGRENHTLTGTPGPSLAVDADGQEGGSQSAKYGRVVHTQEGLERMPLKALKEICRSRKLVMSGKKPDLIGRILTSQLGPYPRGAEGP